MNHPRRTISAVALALALAATAGACGSSGSKAGSGGGYGSSSSTTTASTTANSTSTTSGSATPVTATVKVASVGKLGKVLVASDGRTLYLFTEDQGTTSACTGGCANAWPAYTSTGTPSGGSGVDGAKLATAKGQVANQVVYAGHLLYEFSGDAKPGDANGVNVANWYAVKPDGTRAGG